VAQLGEQPSRHKHSYTVAEEEEEEEEEELTHKQPSLLWASDCKCW
jgi:hypothetical protein